tara:strand:+ start:64824 stop:65105 length:282 start_codon:yes stop_codon:yes gene_type:complete
MLKSQLEEKISSIFKFENETSQEIIDTLIGYMSSAISNNDRIEIRGFGSFFKKKYKSYTGRNPKTGDQVNVPEKVLPLFRPSKELLNKLNDSK